MLIDLFSNKDIIQTNICWYTHISNGCKMLENTD